MDVKQAERRRRGSTVRAGHQHEEPRLLPYSMCEVTEWRGGGRQGGCAGDLRAQPLVSGFKLRLRLGLGQMTGAEFMSWDVLLNKPQTYSPHL